MSAPLPTILIIIGITGDLARRKLLPALGQLAAAGELPSSFHILGLTRRSDVQLDSLLPPGDDYLQRHTELFSLDLTVPADYQRLADRLHQLEQIFGAPAQRLFYLSVPPQVSRPIITLLGDSGLARAPRTKLLLEKPFGTDLDSATDLIQHLGQHFQPHQVYRIDHYLAKETAQNLLVFRDGNTLFKRTWHRDFIERIDITASEQLDIEGRAAFYEQTGALRDLIQSHLLQLAALTLMAVPPPHQLSEVPARRLAALQQLRLPATQPPAASVQRGQYQGYQQAVGHASTVETFVRLTLESRDPRWQGVPITLTTGKALQAKFTDIRITYRKDQAYEADQLILRLQPNEGIELHFWTKAPGYQPKLERHALRFAYREHFHSLPDAYERVFLDAIHSDHQLFATDAEVLATWRILQPIQHAWSLSDSDLISYAPGTAPGQIA